MKTNYEEFMKEDSKQSFGSMEYGYFPTLKDGETVTVRFMVNSPADFDLHTVHNVDIDGKQKRVDCIGDTCPLCRAGVAQTKRFYIPMILYHNNGADQEFVVWDRHKDYAKKLNNYINDYGDLSDILCNITRVGTGLDTEYTISPNVKSAMRSQYPIKSFPNVEPSKYFIMNRNEEEINYFIKTGSFPERVRKSDASSQIPSEVNDIVNSTTVGSIPREEVPFETQTIGRPQRY